MVAVAQLAPTTTVRSTRPALELVRSAKRTIRAEDHLAQVRRIAFVMSRRLPAHVDSADLVGAGTIGLMSAIEKFDPSKNENFEAYAELRIRGAIVDELRSLDWAPRSLRTKARKLATAAQAVQAELGRAPAAEEVAKKLDLSMSAYNALRDRSQAPVTNSIDDTLGTSMEPAADEGNGDILAQLCQQADTAALAQAIDQLPERTRTVLSLHYFEGMKLKQIGAMVGVSESRVCQILKQATTQLKAAIAA